MAADCMVPPVFLFGLFAEITNEDAPNAHIKENRPSTRSNTVPEDPRERMTVRTPPKAMTAPITIAAIEYKDKPREKASGYFRGKLYFLKERIQRTRDAMLSRENITRV